MLRGLLLVALGLILAAAGALFLSLSAYKEIATQTSMTTLLIGPGDSIEHEIYLQSGWNVTVKVLLVSGSKINVRILDPSGKCIYNATATSEKGLEYRFSTASGGKYVIILDNTADKSTMKRVKLYIDAKRVHITTFTSAIVIGYSLIILGVVLAAIGALECLKTIL